MGVDRRRDEPWIFRTYAGHATPRQTNERFRANLKQGQTGLSVAFDLPTQTGYDSDAAMARGEVGRVGVPVSHLGDLRTVFEGIPLARMNTSMTINATAVWLMALFVGVADEQGAPRADLSGTTQNDILKEFLSRGTHIYPPAASIRLSTDLILWSARETPRWNPINVCSYHLQEAGADPVLEVAYTLANAICVLDAVRERTPPDDAFAGIVGRVSFFANAGIRFVEELAKMRAFGRLWDRICTERYGVADPRRRRFRYGVQVNSLGLTAEQPENNVYRILLEMLGVTLSRDARARAVQLPAWNEALGLPRAWDQQWSLRAQQILADETDLLEHDDLFEGSRVVETATERIATEAWEELARVLEMGGSLEGLAYMKGRMVTCQAERLRRIDSGEQVVVGVNRYATSEPSPLAAALGSRMDVVERVEPAAEDERIGELSAWRAGRDGAGVASALGALRRAAEQGANLVPASIEAAHAGVTTGEWADALREVFGEYRPPTGIGDGAAPLAPATALAGARTKVVAAAERIGVGRLRLLIAKPGLDGHSNAAEQIALRARDAGFEVIYQGIRLTPEEIARAASDEDVHAVGLSILSGAHLVLIPAVLAALRREGRKVPVVVGGVIPDDDASALRAMGVARVFTAVDRDLTGAVGEIADLIGRA